jgi:hypothetical protein
MFRTCNRFARCTVALLLLTSAPLAAAEHGSSPGPQPSQTIPDPGTGGYTGEVRPDTPGIGPETRDNDPQPQPSASATTATPGHRTQGQRADKPRQAPWQAHQ